MTKISQTATSLFLGLTILSSCNNADTSKQVAEKDVKPKFDLTVAKKEIEDVNQKFMDLVAKGDTVGIANLYTTDAKLMSAGAPSVEGKVNIQSAFAGFISWDVLRYLFLSFLMYSDASFVAGLCAMTSVLAVSEFLRYRKTA